MIAAHSLERINQVLLYIDNNLDGDLSLETIAGVGCYSAFHLHRLFKAVTGETLNNYISRKRIEKIAFCLMFRKELTVTELSMQYGFSSNSTLTRAFTKFYGVSPTKFRSLLPGEYSKICKADSKMGQAPAIFEQYICNINNCLNYVKMNAKIEIKELPGMSVAYITCIGVDGLDNAFEKIMQWARRTQLVQLPDFKLIRIFHDSFRITGPDKVRMSIGVPLPTPVEVSGEVGLTTVEKGKYIVARFLIAPADFGKSWESLFVWMNENGYKKAPGDPFEFIYNNYNDHPEKKCLVDLCIPVE
jgi:AraC family transcriptional regulator